MNFIPALPTQLLKPVSLIRFHGHYTDMGHYETVQEKHILNCFVEPVDNLVSLTETGLEGTERLFIHSTKPLYAGQNNQRDTVIWQHVPYTLVNLDSWPQFQYWCAQAEQTTWTQSGYMAINDRVRQLVYQLLKAQPGSVSPAYQSAPRRLTPFTTVHITPITFESVMESYGPQAQNDLQEILEGPTFFQANLCFCNDDAWERAHQFARALETSAGRRWLDRLDIGLQMIHPPKQANRDISLCFDFTYTRTMHKPLAFIHSAQWSIMEEN